VSWAAHELESYFLQDHLEGRLKSKISYLAVLLGCLLPDLFTKLPVYGLNIGSMTLIKAQEPWKYHRGWPGVGPTHSLLFIVVVVLVVLAFSRNRAWGLGLLLGGWAHVLTDCFDSVGTMLLFPFTTQHYSTGMWAYAAQEGRYGDAAAYFSSLGGAWDFFWLCLALGGPRVFTRQFFRDRIVPADPVWGRLQRRFSMTETVMLAVYRAYFVYGACRIFGWFLWARLINPERATQTIDLTWGGPAWVERAPSFQRADTWAGFVTQTAFGLAGVSVSLWLIWRFAGRRLWARAA
jgi:membrane-bound metal-dependent hydrolase YbcI (DUF457 family)